MIVTIDDYRGATKPEAEICNNEQIRDEDDDSPFTVARAGLLKLKLQALNSALTRTPLDQHNTLKLDDIVQGVLPRTYVSGSEQVYFLVKGLSWPSKIPDVFIKAYAEVTRSCPFKNRYLLRPLVEKGPGPLPPASFAFAPTFSVIRSLLRELDASCSTKLSKLFDRADENVKPFAFARLPAELRLQIYDRVVPYKPFVRVCPHQYWAVDDQLPVHLDIMRVNRAIYEETTRHFFSKPTLLLESRWEPRYCFYHMYLTEQSHEEYATLIMSMSPEVRRNFSRLEIRVTSGVSGSEQEREHRPKGGSSLQKICAALPNLAAVVISFRKVDERVRADTSHRLQDDQEIHFGGQRMMLDWIHAQLPSKGLRVAWDLTYYRTRIEDAAQLRDKILSARVMREMLERDGILELAQSATATREDLQRWSEIKDIVLEAVKQR